MHAIFSDATDCFPPCFVLCANQASRRDVTRAQPARGSARSTAEAGAALSWIAQRAQRPPPNSARGTQHSPTISSRPILQEEDTCYGAHGPSPCHAMFDATLPQAWRRATLHAPQLQARCCRENIVLRGPWRRPALLVQRLHERCPGEELVVGTVLCCPSPLPRLDLNLTLRSFMLAAVTPRSSDRCRRVG
jgi:hypothetical protein